MYGNKNLRRLIIASVMAGSIFNVQLTVDNEQSPNSQFLIPHFSFMINSVAHAEIKTYIGVGEYIMSDFEKHDIAKQRAKARAEQNAKEQAGVYVRSYSRTENFTLTDDEIIAMTNNIVEVLDVKYEPVPITVSNTTGLMYRATIKVNIDTKNVSEWVKRDGQNREVLVAQNNEMQRVNAANDRQVEDLRKRAQNAETDEERAAIQVAYEQADNEFLSNQKVAEGNDFYFNHNIDNAISSYTQAIELNPNNYIAYCNRGAAYNELNNYEQSIADFEKAIQLKADYPLTYYNLGLTHYNAQLYEQAITDYGKAIELDQKFSAAYVNRGFVKYGLRQFDEAIADFNKALEINPNFAEAYNNRGLVYVELKELDKAIADYRKAIDFNSTYSVAYYNCGNVYLAMQRYELAIDYYDRAIELITNFAEAYNNRAVAYVYLQKYDLAIEDFTKVIELAPNYAQAYYIRGLCYQELGDNEHAQADINKAKELGMQIN
ncbi:MAG: tetratricopeptide repeat protein [Selenomonadaceae bacterium]|nr:tetratricopeptide repeat protein [Selenomonadaceae bacterium]